MEFVSFGSPRSSQLEDHQRCDQTYCPLCARVFRRWFIGELLRLAEMATKSVATLTVLLKKAPHDKIDTLDPKEFRGMLRQRLLRAGLADAVGKCIKFTPG